MTEALNRRPTARTPSPVASPDTDATLTELDRPRGKYGIAPLEPAEAQDANAYAVTKDYDEQNSLTKLSDLSKLGQPIALAANSDCSDVPTAARG